MGKHTDRAAHAKLDAIYARLPRMACKRLCGDEVCGPIFMTTIEADRLRRAVHEAPKTTPRMCGYLRAGACRVYAVRPLICRAYGLVKRLSCPHGCMPERWVTDHEFVELGRAVEAIGGGHVITVPEGLVPFEGTRFADLPTDRVSVAYAERLADLTRGLRAMYHGRVTGIVPGGPGGMVDVNEEDD